MNPETTTQTWKSYVWRIAAVVGVLLAIYLIALAISEFASIKYVGRTHIGPSTISVQGKGEKSVQPDIAVFTYSVSEQAKTVAEAQTKATAKTNKVLEALKANGVEDKDITTVSYTINPEYTTTQTPCFDAPVSAGSVRSIAGCTNSNTSLKGYVVAQSVEVKVRQLENAGKLFETVGSLGVQNVYGLSFSVDNPEEVRAEVRSLAIEDAKKKAEKLARDLGVDLEKIQYFYEDQGYPQPMYESYARDAMSAKGGVMMNQAPQIPSGEQKVVSNVTITYEIE
ncbi:MAG: SIMPL domain-containing protein [Patescibacteria group bacterium]